MENEFVILSKIKFESEEREKIFVDLLKQLGDRVGASVSNATPKEGVVDASNIKISLSEIVTQFLDKFRKALSNNEITRQDVVWLVNDIGFGNSPDGLMFSFSYIKTEPQNIFQRISEILKSAGAIEMTVLRMGSSEEEIIDL